MGSPLAALYHDPRVDWNRMLGRGRSAAPASVDVHSRIVFQLPCQNLRLIVIAANTE
jgi:hypothetical protein